LAIVLMLKPVDSLGQLTGIVLMPKPAHSLGQFSAVRN
jgi:hypothetical protein